MSQRADGTPLVKVLDFGIAKALDELAGADASLTATGTALGSPMYMSPEQVRNAKKVDRRTDIWGLGAVLFELLTGEPPFDADTIPALCASIVTDEPRAPRSLRGDIPEQLEQLILRCLRKKPSDCYTNVGELAEALAPFAPPDASPLVERIQRIVAGRASIPPDAITSWSHHESVADTVASQPGQAKEVLATSRTPTTMTATAGELDDASGLGRERSPRRGAVMALAAAACIAIGWLSLSGLSPDVKTLQSTLPRIELPGCRARARGGACHDAGRQRCRHRGRVHPRSTAALTTRAAAAQQRAAAIAFVAQARGAP